MPYFFRGGVMLHQPQPFGMIREGLQRSVNRYLGTRDIAAFIVPAALGALALAAVQLKSGKTAAG